MDKLDPAPGSGPFGLAVFLASLAALFAASLVAYWAARVLHVGAWPPEGFPALPGSLWLSTALLVVSSGTVHVAWRGARTQRPGLLRAGLALTAGLALAFLAVQVEAWVRLRPELLAAFEATGRANLYGFTFYFLTALHAAHVVGGLIPLLVTSARAFGGRYDGPGRHGGVLMCAMYWHFLDAAWLAIFLSLEV